MTLSWIFNLFDVVDVVVIVSLTTMALFYYFKNFSPITTHGLGYSALKSTSVSTINKADRSFVGRMKAENRQILILFGSQTGTAEELAGRLAKDLVRYGKKALVMDPEDLDVEDMTKILEVPDSLLIFCVATYGEGDPTDNAQALHEYFSNTEDRFTGLRYTVFGLGNKTYEHFNAVGKFFDKKLEELGAKRVFELGLADDDGNMEEDFMRWREHFLPAVGQEFNWELVNNGFDRQYRLEIISEDSNLNLFTGEFGRVGSYVRQRPPYDQKNPYFSKLAISYEIHKKESERSCRHVEFEIDENRVRYEAGDHVGVFPSNDSNLVEKLGKLLDINLDTAFKLINVDEENSKRHPFPCPCTYRTALTHYVDICSPVKSHVLKALSEFTPDESTKSKLALFSTASDEGLKEYKQFIQKGRRNIIDVLEHFSTCKPSIDLLLELLPRLQVRYYSISSSSKKKGDRVSITALVLQYRIEDRIVKGVCTNYLSELKMNDNVPIFIRKSTLKLPHRLQIPVIMIGPGTGFAPFRGFLQERLWQKQQGKELGEMVLFFGCRHPDHDFIYNDELDDYVRENVLTKLHVAFSRAQEQKVYVQHKIWENRKYMWELVQKQASIYVCGDARNMARDVHNMFLKIFITVGELDEERAQQLLKDMERQRRYQTDVWS